MGSTDKLINIIKAISSNAHDARQGVAVLFGLVISAEPLQIKVDQRFTLDDDFLILTSNVIENKLNIDHTHSYTDSSEAGTATKATALALAQNPEVDMQNILLRHALQINDRVILLRVQGGQKYVVLDKVVQ